MNVIIIEGSIIYINWLVIGGFRGGVLGVGVVDFKIICNYIIVEYLIVYIILKNV